MFEEMKQTLLESEKDQAEKVDIEKDVTDVIDGDEEIEDDAEILDIHAICDAIDDDTAGDEDLILGASGTDDHEYDEDDLLTEAGGLISWLKRDFIGHDKGVVSTVKGEIEGIRSAAEAREILDELDGFIKEAQEHDAITGGKSRVGGWRVFTRLFKSSLSLFGGTIGTLIKVIIKSIQNEDIKTYLANLQKLRSEVHTIYTKLAAAEAKKESVDGTFATQFESLTENALHDMLIIN